MDVGGDLMVVELNTETGRYRYRCLFCGDRGHDVATEDDGTRDARRHFQRKHRDLFDNSAELTLDEVLELFGTRECLICHETFPTVILGRHVNGAHGDDIGRWPGGHVQFLRDMHASTVASIRAAKAANRPDYAEQLRASLETIRELLTELTQRRAWMN